MGGGLKAPPMPESIDPAAAYTAWAARYIHEYDVPREAFGRVALNMRANAAVAISVTDPDNPYRMLSLRGRVVEITSEGADAHIDAMAKKYMDADVYPFHQPSDHRVVMVVQPTRTSQMG